MKKIYSSATTKMLQDVNTLVDELGKMMGHIFPKVQAILSNAFGTFWEVTLANPREQREMQDARNAALPEVIELRHNMNNLARQTGITSTRDEEDVALVSVVDKVKDSFDKAHANGLIFDVTGFSDDQSVSAAACSAPTARVKMESSSKKRKASSPPPLPSLGNSGKRKASSPPGSIVPPQRLRLDGGSS